MRPRLAPKARRRKPLGLTEGARPEDSAPMDLDELFPNKPEDPLTLLSRQDLDPLSVDELHERIAGLEAEIARVRSKIDAAVNHRASAEQLFKK
jgi:uncharacterized small protein (DUF1192 family)